MCLCVRCRWWPCECERGWRRRWRRRRQGRRVLPEHAHLSPVLAGLRELPGWFPLPGAGELAPQGRRVGRPGALHAPHLRQHAGRLQASPEPGESGLVAQRGGYGLGPDRGMIDCYSSDHDVIVSQQLRKKNVSRLNLEAQVPLLP